ncbi:MAG: DNA polymerase III subunit beta [Deltaproteobacteria bacterium]|nr:DNA polymerase III subunit beta [Deltaproteobacteria bacterium]
MKFKILRSEFLDALQITQSVVERKNVMPILSNILIEADNKKQNITIIATDLEVAVNLSLQAEVQTSGKITVSAKSLFEIVKESAGQDILVSKSENERVQIISNQSEYKIMGLPCEEFPALPEVKGTFAKISSAGLVKLFDNVSFAMSSDETRYHLNGILIEKNPDGAVMVATDGHRLAYTQGALDISGMQQDKVILPKKGVYELKKFCEKAKEIDLCISDHHVLAQTEGFLLFIRIIDGNFPDYNRVIPSVNPVVIEIPRQSLLGALKRVSLLVNDRSKGVSLYFCNNSLTISSSDPEVGEAKEDIDITYSGAVFTIGFNAFFFIDVLNVIEDECVKIAFKDALSPCLITCDSNPGFKSVVMPMRR